MNFLNILGSVFGGPSILGTTLGAEYNQGLQEESNVFNAQQANYNRLFQHNERLEQQQFQSNEWDRQFSAQNAEYWKRLADERSYNSPASQLQRLRAVGYSPDELAGGASDDTFGVPAGVSVSAPTPSSGSTASSVTPPYIGTSMSSPLGDIQGLAGAFASMAKGNLDTTSAKRINSLLQFECKTAEAESQKVVYEANMSEISADIMRMTKDSKVQEQFWKVKQLKALVSLTDEQGNTEVMKQLNYQEDNLLKMAQRNMTHEQYLNFQLANKWYDDNMESYLALRKAQTAESITAAAVHAQDARQLRLQADLLDVRERIYGISDLQDAKNVVPEDLRHYVEHARDINAISEKEAEEANKIINRMQRYNNLPEWQKDAISVTDYLFDKLGAAVGAAAGGYVGSSLRTKAPIKIRGFQ